MFNPFLCSTHYNKVQPIITKFNHFYFGKLFFQSSTIFTLENYSSKVQSFLLWKTLLPKFNNFYFGKLFFQSSTIFTLENSSSKVQPINSIDIFLNTFKIKLKCSTNFNVQLISMFNQFLYSTNFYVQPIFMFNPF